MKNFGVCLVSVLLIGGSLSPAWAEENEPPSASFSFQFSGLRWAKSETKYSDEADSSELTSLMTSDLVDSTVWATIGKFNIFFYPFQDANSLVSLGYMFNSSFELGVDLGLNANKIKNPKSELSSDLFGVYGLWTVPFEESFLENFAVLDFTRTESTDVNSTTNEEETTKITGSFLKISSTLLFPIAKNAWYMAGVWWAAETGKNHTTDTNKKSTQIGITLAGFRITME
jgi:hypothetical protein